MHMLLQQGEITGNLAEHDGPRHARKQYSESVREFHKFDRQFLLQKIYEARAVECAKFFRGDGMNIGIIVSLDHLLTRLQDNTEWGSLRDYRAYRAAFDDYYEHFDILQFAEDICSNYYVTGAHSQRFVVKYHHALKEFFKTLGIVSDDDWQNRTDPPLFYHIDKQSMSDPVKSVFDFGAIYKNSLALASALNHAFKMHYTTSKMYGYPDRSANFAALFSLWITCPPGSTGTITADGLREIYDGAVKKNRMDRNFDQFLADCTSAKTYAPILVFDGEKYRFDYATLLLHLIYLFSNNRLRSGTQTEAGRTTYDKMRQAAARSFEDEIRQKLLNDGFDVRPGQGEKPFRPSFDNVRREFDCVAVDRERKIIVIVEAKYEDMAPSSMSAGTMVGQLVLDKKTGLLAHAQKHDSRRKFFRRHFDGMRRRGPRPAGRLVRLHRLHALGDQARAADLAPHGSQHTVVRKVHVDRLPVYHCPGRLGRRRSGIRGPAAGRGRYRRARAARTRGSGRCGEPAAARAGAARLMASAASADGSVRLAGHRTRRPAPADRRPARPAPACQGVG